MPLSPASSRGSSSQELAYNQVTANTTISAVTEATANTIVTASALTFDGATIVVIEFYCPATTGAGDCVIELYDGASPIGLMAERGSNVVMPVHAAQRITPAAATKTYSIRGWSAGGGNATVIAGVGGVGAYVPAFVRISRA